ncbi:MAG: 30S ribosomal protein THX [Saprospiraceae bacterium]
MGRGDKRTRKGKITIGSYGKSRPHKVAVKAAAPAPVAKAPKAAEAPKAEKKKKA